MAFQMYAKLHQPPETNDYKRGWNHALEAAASLAEEIEAMCLRMAKGSPVTTMREDGEYAASAREIKGLKNAILELYKEVKT